MIYLMQSTASVTLILLATLPRNKAQFNQQSHMTQVQELPSADGDSACAVSVNPYKSYILGSISCCTIECTTLERKTSGSISCVGFNYHSANKTCQLFTVGQRLYFAVQLDCRYFMNIDVVGPNTSYTVCPASYSYVDANRGCYMVWRVSLDWESSARNCQKSVENGHLVFITDSQEEAVVETFLDDRTGCNNNHWGVYALWIGLQCQDPAYFAWFVWKLNTSSTVGLLKYNNWAPNQPDNSGSNERCGSIVGHAAWDDYPCSYSLCSICELDL